MSREIKFRAWNKETQKMIDVHRNTPLALNAEMNTQMAIQGFSGLFLPFHKDIILMQYAGMKDKNGKEIYEGDIYEWCQPLVQNCKQIYRGHRSIVFWSINELFYLKNRKENNASVEIIGNIHENPELLEKK